MRWPSMSKASPASPVMATGCLTAVAFPVAILALVLDQIFQPLVHGFAVLLRNFVRLSWIRHMHEPGCQSQKTACQQKEQDLGFHVAPIAAKPQSRLSSPPNQGTLYSQIAKLKRDTNLRSCPRKLGCCPRDVSSSSYSPEERRTQCRCVWPGSAGCAGPGCRSCRAARFLVSSASFLVMNSLRFLSRSATCLFSSARAWSAFRGTPSARPASSSACPRAAHPS